MKRLVLSSLLVMSAVGIQTSFATSVSFEPFHGINSPKIVNKSTANSVPAGGKTSGMFAIEATTPYYAGQVFSLSVYPYTTFDPSSTNLSFCDSQGMVGQGTAYGSTASITLDQNISSGTYYVTSNSCQSGITLDISPNAINDTAVYVSVTDPSGVSYSQELFTISSQNAFGPISFTAFLPNVQANQSIGLDGWIKIYATTSGSVGIGLQGSASSGSYCEVDSLSSGSALYVNISNLLNECGLSTFQTQGGVPIELDFSGLTPNQVFVYAYVGQGATIKRIPLNQSLNQNITSFTGYLPNIQGNPGVVDGWIKIYSTVAGSVNISIAGGQSCTSIYLTPNQPSYIQNSQLLSMCGLTPIQAQGGVPIELQFNGPTPDQVSVYAYEGFGDIIKRVPFTIPSTNSVNTISSY